VELYGSAKWVSYLITNPKQEILDIWHSSNWDEKEYAESAPPEVFELWTDEEKDWAGEIYNSQEVEEIRSRYIEIYRQLKTEPIGAKRTELVMEASRMERSSLQR